MYGHQTGCVMGQFRCLYIMTFENSFSISMFSVSCCEIAVVVVVCVYLVDLLRVC